METIIPLTKDTITSMSASPEIENQTQKVTTFIPPTKSNEQSPSTKMTESAIPTTTARITAAIVTKIETTAETRATSREPMRTSTIASSTMPKVESPLSTPMRETPVPNGNAEAQTGKY